MSSDSQRRLLMANKTTKIRKALASSPHLNSMLIVSISSLLLLLIYFVTHNGSSKFKILSKRDNMISSVAFSGDGKLMAYGSTNGTVSIWYSKSREHKLTIYAYPKHVISTISFSPSGDLLVSGGYDKTVRLWNVQTGQLVRSLKSDSVHSVSFSPDGKKVISGSNAPVGSGSNLHAGGSVNVWDVNSGRLIWKIESEDIINSVAFSPDSKSVLIGDSGGYIKIINMTTKKVASSFKLNSQRVNRAIFLDVPDSVLSAGDGISIWNTKHKSLSRHIEQEGEVKSVSYNGSLLAVSNNRDSVEVWNIGSAQIHEDFPGQEKTVTSVALSPDGKEMLTGDRGGNFKIWRIGSR